MLTQHCSKKNTQHTHSYSAHCRIRYLEASTSVAWPNMYHTAYAHEVMMISLQGKKIKISSLFSKTTTNQYQDSDFRIPPDEIFKHTSYKVRNRIQENSNLDSLKELLRYVFYPQRTYTFIESIFYFFHQCNDVSCRLMSPVDPSWSTGQSA